MSVEVAYRGRWLDGELLGWQHDTSGRCLARVRCVIDGLRYTAWIGLPDLRLPELAVRDRDGGDATETAEAQTSLDLPPTRHLALGEHTRPRLVHADRGLVGGPPTVPPRPRTPGGTQSLRAT